MKVKGHVALEWPGVRAFAPAATTPWELLCLELGARLGLCPVCDPPSVVLEGATKGVRGWFAEVGGDRSGRVNLDVLCDRHPSSEGAFPAGPGVCLCRSRLWSSSGEGVGSRSFQGGPVI